MERKEKLGILKIGYNPTDCKYFDELNKQNGWNLQHALNGGEIKCKHYLLDAYDKERNIVVEYDESHHFDVIGNLKEKDIVRMNNIIEKLNCKFFRFNENKQSIEEIHIYDRKKDEIINN